MQVKLWSSTLRYTEVHHKFIGIADIRLQGISGLYVKYFTEVKAT